MLKKSEEIISRLTKVSLLINFGKGTDDGNHSMVTQSGRLGNSDKNLITPVVFRGVTNVETINTMRSKGGSLSRGVVDDDSGAGHC